MYASLIFPSSEISPISLSGCVLQIPSKFVHYRSNGSSSAPDYIEVVFLIQMSRKTLYYTVNLIVPTGLMSILICIVFCLPTAAGEKMTLCMSILLALNLFQLLVTKILPPTSAVVPLIAKYLLFTFTLNVLVIGTHDASRDCSMCFPPFRSQHRGHHQFLLSQPNDTHDATAATMVLSARPSTDPSHGIAETSRETIGTGAVAVESEHAVLTSRSVSSSIQ